MNDMILAQTDKLTMSSREIAELTGKQHSKVMQVIIDLSEKGIAKSATPTKSKNAQNGQYYDEFDLDKRDSLVLVARLSPEFTAAIVDRWQELEAKQAPAKLSRKELAMMVIESENAREVAEQEVERLQGVCNTIAAQFAPGMTAPKFCKQLNGVNTQQVTNTLISMNKLIKNASGVVPTSYARDRYFAEKQEEYGDKPRSKSVLTLKGAKWLYRAYLSNKLPMKQSWDGNFSHIIFGDDS